MVFVALAAVLASGGCAGEPAHPRADARDHASPSEPPPSRSRPRPKRPTAPREPIRPKTPIVQVEALGGADRWRVVTAIRDLKTMGFWDDLTGHLEVVRVSTRPGAERIPDDERLADSVYTARLTGPVRGQECDILVFSRALADDVVRQAAYYAEGRLAAPPPSLRQFWSVILAHELGHCTTRGQRGEGFSTTWERRVLERLGVARIGS